MPAWRRPGIGILILLLALAVGIAWMLFRPQPGPRGVDIYVRNDTASDYALHLTLADPGGQALGRLTIPVAARSLAQRQLDASFTRIEVRACLTAPDGADPLAERLAGWPGEAGTAAGAASDRVAVELRVEERNGEPVLEFAGAL